LILFADREPVGPYKVTVGARRTLHLRFNDLEDPAQVPRDTDYASIFESDVPIIVQHTRLDSRRAELALLSTIRSAEASSKFVRLSRNLSQCSGVPDWPDLAAFSIPPIVNGIQ
jgi:hypothetical protein